MGEVFVAVAHPASGLLRVKALSLSGDRHGDPQRSGGARGRAACRRSGDCGGNRSPGSRGTVSVVRLVLSGGLGTVCSCDPKDQRRGARPDQRRAACPDQRRGSGAGAAAHDPPLDISTHLRNYCADMSTKEQQRPARPRRRPLPLGHRRRPGQARGQRRRHEHRGARGLPRRAPAGHRRGARAALGRSGGQRAGRRPGVRRDLPPRRPPAAHSCDTVLRIRGASAGADGWSRSPATRASSWWTRSRSCPDAQGGAAPADPRAAGERRRLVAAELPERLGVSRHGVQHDLDGLAESAQLPARARRGARALAGRGGLEGRQIQSVDGKIAAARAAATLLEPGPVVILDGGSTRCASSTRSHPATRARS